MSNEIKKLNKEITILRKINLDYEKQMVELLMIPEVREFYNIITDNEKIKNTLKTKEKEYTLKSMQECEHAFVITEIVKESECGCIRRTPVYHCVKCGLTNEYDVKEINDLVDEIKSQMAFIFGDTSMNGVLLSNEVISLIEAIDVYKGIVAINQNITNSELKKLFPSVLLRIQSSKEQKSSVSIKKLTPPKNTQTK